jgi:hypothetical protein
MSKKTMKSALADSLRAEDDAVKMRFEKAESLFANKPQESGQPVAAEPEPEESGVLKKPEPAKVIRDSFTLPAQDYELITRIKQRCLQAALNATKSEVIRAGLHALDQMEDEELLAMIGSLEKVKTGRPATKVKRK